jgi:hypothetical protein
MKRRLLRAYPAWHRQFCASLPEFLSGKIRHIFLLSADEMPIKSACENRLNIGYAKSAQHRLHKSAQCFGQVSMF